MVRIYTRAGDKGETTLFGGQKIKKNNIFIEAHGTIDELNSALGVVIADLKNQVKIKNELLKIQKDLFGIGGQLIPREKRLKIKSNLEQRVGEFEKIIARLSQDLPEIHHFILPGGGKAGSFLHLARTIARRAERRIVTLGEKEKIDKRILMYFNRLSDLLFVFARFVNFQEKQKEIVWIKN